MQIQKTKNLSGLSTFSPNFKRKRIAPSRTSSDILPKCNLDESARGIFTGFTVEVCNPDHIRKLYDCGGFGKGSKSRSCPEFIKQKVSHDESNDILSETLMLDLEEAFFLTHYLKVLQIEDVNGVLLNSEQLIEEFLKVKSNFVDNLVAYLYLRSKNWIVRSGTKFGANFLIYKKGLRFFHASFIVIVDNTSESHLSKDIKGMQRIAETSDKDIIFLEISAPRKIKDILHNLNKFTVSENIIKRFNYSACVQSK